MKVRHMIVPFFLSLLLIAGCGVSTTTSKSQNSSISSGQQNKFTRAEIKMDAGRYSGRIDSNSIEIRISGVPEEMDPQVYRLSETLKENFDIYNLQTGDDVMFKYIINEHGQKVLEEIISISRSSQKPQEPSNF